MPAPLTIAAAQPSTVPGDPVRNARAHARAVAAAGARIVVFPELSLTGYELDAETVPLDTPALEPVREACAEHDCWALVGAPVRDGAGGRCIATLLVGAGEVRVAYRKLHLGGDEPGRFVPGPEPVVLAAGGWRLGLGICRDSGVPEQVRATAALGLDAYLAGLVHRPDELGKQDRRGAAIAREYGVHVVFASAAGVTGGDYPSTAGCSAIWAPGGAVLDRVDERPDRIARATLIRP